MRIDLTTIKKVYCKRCGCYNYIDVDIVNYDFVAKEENQLIHHCTFCTKVLDREPEVFVK